jgi:hypothetical protein
VYYNWRLKPSMRPAAIEFLDNILQSPLKEAVVPLLESASGSETQRLPQQVEFVSVDATISSLASGEDPWLSVIATELHRRLGEHHESREHRIITRR